MEVKRREKIQVQKILKESSNEQNSLFKFYIIFEITTTQNSQ